MYVLMNHSTSYDAVALFHCSANRFGVVMDREAFEFPVIGHPLTRWERSCVTSSRSEGHRPDSIRVR